MMLRTSARDVVSLVFVVFYDEVLSTLERALRENISKENMILEINSVKYVKSVYHYLTFWVIIFCTSKYMYMFRFRCYSAC